MRGEDGANLIGRFISTNFNDQRDFYTSWEGDDGGYSRLYRLANSRPYKYHGVRRDLQTWFKEIKVIPNEFTIDVLLASEHERNANSIFISHLITLVGIPIKGLDFLFQKRIRWELETSCFPRKKSKILFLNSHLLL